MISIKPTHLAAIGCFAIACAGPSAATYQAQISESQAQFAPGPSDKDKNKKAQNARARAVFKAVDKRGRTIGTLTLEQKGEWVTLEGQFKNLPPGLHGFQIHTNGNCSGASARKSGSDYNPTDSRHGPPGSARRHVGDLGNLDVDRNGRATFEMRTDSMTVTKDGPSSVFGRSVVITANKDDGRSQPDGNAGPAIACGVIR
jgi:Cu-Zn family superoxide dismutase